MRALRLKDAKQFELVDVAKPEVDDVNVVVKVHMTAICGTDVHLWDMGGSAKGWILGHEFSGVVDHPGSREDLKKGDRVVVIPGNPCGECAYCKMGDLAKCVNQTAYVGIGLDGAYSEYVKTRPDMVVPLPEQVSDQEASLIEPSSVAFRAAKRAQIKDGESVLIAGCGIIGSMTAKWARMMGAKNIVMTDTNAFRRNVVKEKGLADATLDALDPDYIQKAKDLTKDGLGFDKYIDCVGNQAALNTNIEVVKTYGHILMAGYPTQLVPMNITQFVTKELTMSSTFAYEVSDIMEVMESIATKMIDLNEFVTKVIKLDEVPQMFEELHSPANGQVKVIIDVLNS